MKRFQAIDVGGVHRDNPACPHCAFAWDRLVGARKAAGTALRMLELTDGAATDALIAFRETARQFFHEIEAARRGCGAVPEMIQFLEDLRSLQSVLEQPEGPASQALCELAAAAVAAVSEIEDFAALPPKTGLRTLIACEEIPLKG